MFFLTDDFPVGDSCHFQWVQWQDGEEVKSKKPQACGGGVRLPFEHGTTGHGTV